MHRSARRRCGWSGPAGRVLFVGMAAWWGGSLPAHADADEGVVAMAAQAQEGHGPARPARLALSLTPPIGRPGTGALDVGVTWRQPITAQHTVDITAWRRVEGQDASSLIRQREPVYGARVEIGLTPSRPGFTLDQRFLGFQMENGMKIGLRRKNGGPVLYFRQQF